MTFSGNSVGTQSSPSLTAADAAEAGASPAGKRGFFATLTPEQEARVMAYRGPETLADPGDLAKVLADAAEHGGPIR